MTTLTPNTYTQCPVELVVKSLTNRKHFDPEALQALSDNIKARGIDQPIIVRALPGARLAETFGPWPASQPKPAYEIVSGERRYRAAVMAGLAQVPVIMRQYTDLEAIEAQLVENIQRESLSELDEAEGFEVWLQQPGITIDVVADKISKSRRYVFSRLQLLKLQPETKQALRTNHIDVSRALLLAPVHDPKLQIKALEYATTASDGTVPSVRLLQVWLQQNVMLALDRAPFPIMLASLVPAAGACKPDCPKRTSASPDIFEYVVSADTCTDLLCWKAKETAHTAALQAKADKLGMRLVHGKEAKGICYEKSSTLRGYSPLSQVRNDLASGTQGQRLDALLGHSAAIPLPNAVLIENPFTRELITAVPTEEAEAALLASGLVKVMESAAPDIKADRAKSKKDFEADVAALESKVNDLIKLRYVALSRAAVVTSIMGVSEMAAHALLTPELLRAFVRAEISLGIAHDALKNSALAAVKDTDELTDAQVCQAVALIMTFGGGECQQTYAVEHGIDTRAITKQATIQIKAEVAAQIAALKPQKTPPPKSPLAQPSATPVADAENQKLKPKGKAQAKAKLSAKDAQLGIAEAMQGIEAPPADGAGAVPPAAGQFTKGQQVVVKAVSTQRALWRQKYEGMTGTVKTLNFDCALNMNLESYEVTFKGRTGGVADFTADELEAA